MTKKLWIILVTIVVIICLTVVYSMQLNNSTPSNTNEPKTIWQLMDNMDSLRTLKEECVNNLNIVDSAKFLKGYTWYCDSWDAEITELRDQISLMSKKDYEGLN
jgi:hypothetical protein